MTEPKDALLPRDLNTILGELAGAASMCWIPHPSGQFASTMASTFVDAAKAEIDRRAIPCAWCGMMHQSKCPLIKSIEYFEDGRIKRVEFHGPTQPATPTVDLLA